MAPLPPSPLKMILEEQHLPNIIAIYTAQGRAPGRPPPLMGSDEPEDVAPRQEGGFVHGTPLRWCLGSPRLWFKCFCHRILWAGLGDGEGNRSLIRQWRSTT